MPPLGMDTWIGENTYPDLAGFGEANQLFQDIRKALNVSGVTPGRAGQTDLDALGIEDLSPILASAEIRERQLHFWRDIPKDPVYSMNAEWSRVDQLGEYGATGFIGGTDSGIVTDPVFARLHKEIKFLAVKGEIGLPGQLVKLVGFRGVGQNVMDTSEELKMLELLRHTERNLFYGDSAVASIEWDGVIAQIDAGADATNRVRMDLRGEPLDEEFLEELSLIAANNSADMDHFYATNQQYRDLRQSLFGRQRAEEPFERGKVGARFEQFMIEEIGGDPDYVKIRRTQLLTRGVKGGLPLGVPTAASPNAPTAPSSVTGAAAAHTATEFEPGLAAGTYYFSATAVSKGGRTLETASAGVVATAGQKITWTINSADANVLFFEIFRNKLGTESSAAGNRKFMGRINRTGAATTHLDAGKSIPGAADFLGLCMSLDEIQFKQLLPVVKRVLPQALMSNSYGILLFGTPIVRIPTHNVHVANVGERVQGGVTGA